MLFCEACSIRGSHYEVCKWFYWDFCAFCLLGLQLLFFRALPVEVSTVLAVERDRYVVAKLMTRG
jgi:hypothetical protein